MYTIGINFDEISDDLHEALQVMQECGVRYGELRTLKQKNFVFWTDDEIDAFKRVTDAHHIEVVAAASPLFKWYMHVSDETVEHDSFGFNPRLSEQEKLLLLEKALHVAVRLAIPRIRVFSGLGRTARAGLKISQNPLFQQALKLAAARGIELCIENEPTCRVHTKNDILELLDSNQSAKLKLWLDIANLLEVDEDIDEAFLRAISSRLGYLHVKDYVKQGNRKVYVPVGYGIINYQDIFQKIEAIHPSNDLIVTVETHARKNRAEFSARSIMGIRKIIEKSGGRHDKQDYA